MVGPAHELVAVDATHAVACGGGIVLRLIDGRPSGHADIDLVQPLFRRELEHHPLVGYLQVIYEGTPPMESEARKRGAQMIDGFGGRVRSVYVLEGSTPWTIVLRMGLKTFTRLVRSPTKIESSIERAAFELGRQLPTLEPEDLWARSQELRAKMQAARGGQGKEAATQ